MGHAGERGILTRSRRPALSISVAGSHGAAVDGVSSSTGHRVHPDRVDAFSNKEQKGRRTYKEAMEEVMLDREEKEVNLAIEKKLAEFTQKRNG